MSKQIKNLIFGEQTDIYTSAPIVDIDMQGWNSQSPAFNDVISTHKPKLIVEVGTWKGGSAINMANICKNIYANNDFEIVCIDTFLGSIEHWNHVSYSMTFESGRPTIYKTFVSNVVRNNHADVITPFPVDSRTGHQVLKHFGVQADLVYIDAGHDFGAVVDDINGYKSILKPGGILLGDDIHLGSIVDACNATLPNWRVLYDKFYWINR